MHTLFFCENTDLLFGYIIQLYSVVLHSGELLQLFFACFLHDMDFEFYIETLFYAQKLCLTHRSYAAAGKNIWQLAEIGLYNLHTASAVYDTKRDALIWRNKWKSDLKR